MNLCVLLPPQSSEDPNLRAGTPREEKAFPLGGGARRDVILLILLHLGHYELSAIHTTQLTRSDRRGGRGGPVGWRGRGGRLYFQHRFQDGLAVSSLPAETSHRDHLLCEQPASEAQGLFDLDLQIRASGLVTFIQMETTHTTSRDQSSSARQHRLLKWAESSPNSSWTVDVSEHNSVNRRLLRHVWQDETPPRPPCK